MELKKLIEQNKCNTKETLFLFSFIDINPDCVYCFIPGENEKSSVIINIYGYKKAICANYLMLEVREICIYKIIEIEKCFSKMIKLTNNL